MRSMVGAYRITSHYTFIEIITLTFTQAKAYSFGRNQRISGGPMTPERLRIFDTTLRDGEQSPGCSMNLSEKLRLARKLESLGVDIIEAGFPIASDGDFAAVRAVAAECRNTTIAALCRTSEQDVRRAAEALRDAAHPRIHTFVATSDIHLEYKLKKTRNDVIDMTRSAVRLARDYIYVQPIEAICEKIDETIALGGTGVLMQGGLHPDFDIEWYEDLLRTLSAKYPGFQLHCFSPPEIHNIHLISGLDYETIMQRLKDAGLYSLPGGGAEILNDEVRKRVATKCTTQEWLDVMRAVHRVGLRSSATMMFGIGDG